MADDIQDWAKQRACDLAGMEPTDRNSKTPEEAGGIMISRAFARYIQQHEKPPVDPLYEALKAVVELGRYDTREQTELLRGELARRGLTIVKLASQQGDG